MARTVQLRRGTSEEHANFIGLEGELTYDKTLNQLRLHDGVTAGGKIIPDIPPAATPWNLGLVQLSSLLTSSALGLGLTASAGKILKDSLQAAYQAPAIFPRASLSYYKKEVNNVSVRVPVNTSNAVHTLSGHGLTVGDIIVYTVGSTTLSTDTVIAVTSTTFTTNAGLIARGSDYLYTVNLHGVITSLIGIAGVPTFTSVAKDDLRITFKDAMPHEHYIVVGSGTVGAQGCAVYASNSSTTATNVYTKNSSGVIVAPDTLEIMVLC